MIDELEGRAPQRVIADVELTCQEEFALEDGEGRVVHKPEPCGRKAWTAVCIRCPTFGTIRGTMRARFG